MRNILLKNISKNSRLTWQTPFFLFIDKSFFSSSSSSRSPLQCLVNPDKKTPLLVFFPFIQKKSSYLSCFACQAHTRQNKDKKRRIRRRPLVLPLCKSSVFHWHHILLPFHQFFHFPFPLTGCPWIASKYTISFIYSQLFWSAKWDLVRLLPVLLLWPFSSIFRLLSVKTNFVCQIEKLNKKKKTAAAAVVTHPKNDESQMPIR